MRLLALSVFLISYSIFTNGQIVNIEKERKKEEGSGWSGNIDLSLNFTKTVTQVIQASSRIAVQYAKNKNTWLLLGDLGIVQADGENFLNSGFLHARYNRKITDRFLTAEVFTQTQYNKVQLIERRTLAGIGPRFRFVENDSLQLFLGPLVMYENERLTNNELNRDVRVSTYFSFGYNFRDKVIFSTITYYQPLITRIYDYRVSHESMFKFIITEHFAFKVTYNLVYDSQPPETIPNLNYSLINAVSINF